MQRKGEFTHSIKNEVPVTGPDAANQEESKVGPLQVSKSQVEDLLRRDNISSYEFLSTFKLESKSSFAQTVTVEEFFKPSLLLKDPKGQLNPKVSYDISSFDDMDVIGEGTYGKVYKGRLSETQIEKNRQSNRVLEDRTKDDMIVK